MSERTNKAASALGKLRWAGVSAEERQAAMTELGKRRQALLTPADRLAIGKRLAAARAAKRIVKQNPSAGQSGE